MAEREVTDAEARAVFDGRRDNEGLFDRDIAPILHVLRRACRARGIPFFAAVQFSEYGLAQYVWAPVDSHGAFDKFAEVMSTGDPLPPEGVS
jgi:hypothetical protein